MGDIENMLNAFKRAFPYTIPIMTGYIFIGIAYGIVIADKGYSFLWAGLMSFFILTGSAQFMGVAFLTPGVSLIQVALMTLVIDLRHLFFAISMVDRYNRFGPKRWLMIYAMTDETYGLMSTLKVPDDVDEESFLCAISVLDWAYWVIGSMLGALIGNLLPIDTSGIDFAMTALFIVLLVEQWQNKTARIPIIIGGLSTAVALAIFGPDTFVPISMAVFLSLLLIMKKRLEVNENAD